MTALTLHLPDLCATQALGRRIAQAVGPGDAVLLDGPLGAGKSTLARAMIRCLADDPALEVPSPTYTLVQAYATAKGPLSHFDLWRLDGPAALPELGWDEALDGIVIVEWPDRLGGVTGGFWPARAITVQLALAGEDARDAVVAGLAA